MTREPLVWFLVTGVLLFAGNSYLNPPREGIVVDSQLRAQLASLWQTQMGREPSSSERESILQSWLEEELLYREAVRMNLADDDVIVRRRLVQKLEFLLL